MFHANRVLVDQHNAAGRNFTLALNKFADWTQVCSNPLCAIAAACSQTLALQAGPSWDTGYLPLSAGLP